MLLSKAPKFRITIARILSNYPAKTFTIKAADILSAQIRVLQRVGNWYNIFYVEKVKGINDASIRNSER